MSQTLRLPSHAELNRVQPAIDKITIVPQPDDPDFVAVKVAVSSKAGQCLRGGNHVPCESGVYDLRLYRDGHLVGRSPALAGNDSTGGRNWLEQLQQWRKTSDVRTNDGGPITVTKGKQEITFTGIRLPRLSDVSQVEFTAYAFNEDRVKSETSEPVLYTLPKSRLEGKPRAYVITVGVDVTSDPNLRLSFAPNGAIQVERLLVDKLQSQYEVVPVRLLSEYRPDGNDPTALLPTKNNLREVLAVLSAHTPDTKKRDFPALQSATPDDLVVVYIASHGYADPNGKFYAIPSDIGDPAGVSAQLLDRCLKNPEQSLSCQSARDYLGHSISSDELTQWLQTIDAGQMVLVLDSCHSGAISGPGFKAGPMGDPGFGQLSYDKGMLVLAATQADNVDWGTLELGDRSLLTYALTQPHTAPQRFDIRQWLIDAVRRVPELYTRFVKDGPSSSENRIDQEPALFDFSKRRLTKE